MKARRSRSPVITILPAPQQVRFCGELALDFDCFGEHLAKVIPLHGWNPDVIAQSDILLLPQCARSAVAFGRLPGLPVMLTGSERPGGVAEALLKGMMHDAR